MICKKEHQFNQKIADLPEIRSTNNMHKCCYCAFEKGFEDGFYNSGWCIDWNLIDDSSTTDTHKSAEDAYIIGYNDGSKARREKSK